MSGLEGVAPLVVGLTWEEMSVGRRFRTGSRTITEADLVGFVTSMGFTESLFLDARHAAENGYAGRLVPAALTYCVTEGLTLQTNVLHGTGVAFLRMELDVKAPVFVGDTITCVVEITESRPTSRPGRGLVTTTNTVFNERGDEVLVYTPMRLVRGRDSSPEHA